MLLVNVTPEKKPPPIGILLLNIGTPNSPQISDVRRYLCEFLMDPYVITLPTLLRAILVYGVIVPFRVKRSAAAYQKIWSTEGSPLRMYGEKFRAALNNKLGPGFKVVLGMRYGQPHIAAAIEELMHAQCEKILVFPLFPQYAQATTGSAIAVLQEILSKKRWQPQLKFKQDFFQEPAFITSYATIIRVNQPKIEPEYWIFSYHGLPEQAIKKSCLQGQHHICKICPPLNSDNQNCYRAQCFTTSRLLAQALNLPETHYITTFQSRLGAVPWIQPYTDIVLQALAARGLKHIVIVCPSFVMDCLETLEEIGIRAKEQWHRLGGGSLHLIPCLNADPIWIQNMALIIQKELTA